MKLCSFDARSWDHPTHPNKVTARCDLAGDRRVPARRGWAGEKVGLFEHPAGYWVSNLQQPLINRLAPYLPLL